MGTGDELIENEKVRKNIRDLYAANSGTPNQAYEAAKEKLKIMMSIEKEVIVELPTALMEYHELAAYRKLPSSNTSGLEKKAKDLSELFGDNHLYLYNQYLTSKICNWFMGATCKQGIPSAKV